MKNSGIFFLFWSSLIQFANMLIVLNLHLSKIYIKKKEQRRMVFPKYKAFNDVNRAHADFLGKTKNEVKKIPESALITKFQKNQISQISLNSLFKRFKTSGLHNLRKRNTTHYGWLPLKSKQFFEGQISEVIDKSKHLLISLMPQTHQNKVAVLNFNSIESDEQPE